MKAIICAGYGPPDVLKLAEVEKPRPKENEILIRIYATAVTTVGCNSRRGEPFASRFVTGLRKPKKIYGFELAGEVESVGKDVTRFKAGDQVFGATTLRLGAYAEYICLPEDGPVAIKPTNMSYAQAAAIVEGGLTALPCLRDHAKIQKGQHVLINGASGSTGTAAVQLAKHFGAEVTGVCSTGNLALLRSLGAHKAIDYTREDFTESGKIYDAILAIAGNTTFSRCRGALKQGGVYITAAPTLAVAPQLLRMRTKRAVIAFTGLRPTSEKVRDLVFLRELIEAGKLTAVIDRWYPLDRIVEAHRYVDTGRKRGNVVLCV